MLSHLFAVLPVKREEGRRRRKDQQSRKKQKNIRLCKPTIEEDNREPGQRRFPSFSSRETSVTLSTRRFGMMGLRKSES
jgi:hypothetical protein